MSSANLVVKGQRSLNTPPPTPRYLHIDRSQYEWRPFDCKLKRFTKSEAIQCLNQRKILIAGDSQQRTLWNVLGEWACDIQSLGPVASEAACHIGEVSVHVCP